MPKTTKTPPVKKPIRGSHGVERLRSCFGMADLILAKLAKFYMQKEEDFLICTDRYEGKLRIRIFNYAGQSKEPELVVQVNEEEDLVFCSNEVEHFITANKLDIDWSEVDLNIEDLVYVKKETN